MGFEENREDAWRDRGGPKFTKEALLKTAVESGAVQAGYFNGHECPYYGVHDHAEELVREGLLKKYDGLYRLNEWVDQETIWVPTEAGKKAVKP
jgi:hypothetical protein